MSERMWTRKKILKSPMFLRTLQEITVALNKAKVKHALIGGLAVAYHANPPVTIDADFLVDTENMDFLELLFWGLRWGVFPVVFRRGNQRGFPKYGWALRRKGSTDIDVISTSGDAYLKKVVSEAVVVSLKGIRVPMVTAEDLIVMKTLVGRDKDVEDTIVLRQHVDVNEDYIKKTLGSLM